MSIPELVTIHTSLLTDLGDAVRERFGVSGDLTIEEMTDVVLPLPDEYQAIDYIQTTGTQYIDTGIKLTDIRAIYCELTFTDIDGVYQSNGVYSVANGLDNGCWLGVRASNTYAWGFPRKQGGNTFYIENGYASASKVKELILIKPQTFIVDNNAVVSTDVEQDSTKWNSNLNFYIGCRNRYDSGASEFAKEKVHIFNFYGEGFSPVACFAPVKRKSDNEAGLFDMIGRTFHTNQGTGSLITP